MAVTHWQGLRDRIPAEDNAMASGMKGCESAGFETDVVTREIVRGKLLAVADEMGVVLARSSMSPVIYEVLDFACGFCDADGELVSQTNGITVFTGTFSIQINIIKEKFAGRIRPGDIYMLNDPYRGGTHYNDVGVIKPVFVDGELFAFAISISHWTDVGGKVAGLGCRPTPPRYSRKASASPASTSTRKASARTPSSR